MLKINPPIPGLYGALITGLAMTEYADGNPCLMGLFTFPDSPEDAPEWNALSVNAPDSMYALPPEILDAMFAENASPSFFVKSYSEREGMLEALENAGVVRKLSEAKSGFVMLPYCELLLDVPEVTDDDRRKGR